MTISGEKNFRENSTVSAEARVAWMWAVSNMLFLPVWEVKSGLKQWQQSEVGARLWRAFHARSGKWVKRWGEPEGG